jgi:P27 family predicted phage terminase small subunit
VTAVLKLVRPDAVPAPPKNLSAVGKAEWRRVAPLMLKRGTLREEILSVLEAYCMAVAQARQYADEAAGQPVVIPTADGKGLKRNPVHGFLAEALKQVGVFSKVLGLAVGSKGRAFSEDVEADRARWSGCDVE